MSHSTASVLPFALILALASVLPAQLGQPHGGRFDAQSVARLATGVDHALMQGVARDAGGEYYVATARATAASKHRLLRFSSTGAYVAGYDQPAAVQGSANGLLDLAYDSAANVVYGGCEVAAGGAKLFAFDVATAAFAPAKDLGVPTSLGLTTLRGLAFDPFGASGAGTVYVCDQGPQVYELRRDGSLVRAIPCPHPLPRALALDPGYRLLWAFGSGGTGRANTGVVGIAADLGTGAKNGLVVLGDPTVAGTPAGGNVQGVEFEVSGHDHNVAKFVLLADAQSDTVYSLVAAFRSGSTCGGTVGFRGDAPYAGNPNWTPTLTGSSAGQAWLLLHSTHAVQPVFPPIFNLGCTLYVSLTPGPIFLGPVPVQGGQAQVTLPIPAGLAAGDLVLQWLETASPFAFPVQLSDAGRTHIYP